MKKFYISLLIALLALTFVPLTFATDFLINENGDLVNKQGQLINDDGLLVDETGTIILKKEKKFIGPPPIIENPDPLARYKGFHYMSRRTVDIYYSDNQIYTISQHDEYDGVRHLTIYPFTYTFERDGDVDIFLKGNSYHKIEIDSPYDDRDDALKRLFYTPKKKYNNTTIIHTSTTITKVGPKTVVKKKKVVIKSTPKKKKKPAKKKVTKKKTKTKKKK